MNNYPESRAGGEKLKTLNDVDNWDRYNRESQILCDSISHFKVENGIESVAFNFGNGDYVTACEGECVSDNEIGLDSFPIVFLATVVRYTMETVELGSSHDEYQSLYDRLIENSVEE
jgi:hypothetical protein